jgi:anthranilate synthase/aminodeoxychorismate synthase-like glutamine amidotransferase
MKIALIDNNDSFTYNIVDYLRRMRGVGLSVINTERFDLDELEAFDKIILSPGPGLPADFKNLNKIIHVFHNRKPILGICLGHQAIASYFGAKLVNVKPVIHGQAHRIKLLNSSILFNTLPSTFKVGLYHSWAVSQENFPEILSIDALSEQNVIMSFSVKEYPVWGVQFHPESYITEYGFDILQNFIEL